jgi:molybdenum cofactor cytidylyltransferase
VTPAAGSALKIAAIVLAAGRSSRMPANKLLAPLDGKPVIRHTVEAVCASAASPVIVVTGHQADSVRGALAGLPVSIAENVRFTDGLSSSLICGVNSLPAGIDGTFVVLGDMPFVSPAVMDRMVAAFAPAAGRAIVVPVHGGRRGNPVLWSAALIDEFRHLTGDKGAKQLMALHGDLLYELEVGTDSVLTDLDTQKDFSGR